MAAHTHRLHARRLLLAIVGARTPAMAAAATPGAALNQEEEEKDEEMEIDLLFKQQQPQSSSSWPPGLPLQTLYGWGSLRRRRRPPPEGDGMLEVRLEWGARCYLRPGDVLDR